MWTSGDPEGFLFAPKTSHCRDLATVVGQYPTDGLTVLHLPCEPEVDRLLSLKRCILFDNIVVWGSVGELIGVRVGCDPV